MIPNDATPPKRTTHDYTWQTLVEFTQSGEAGGEYLAADQVVEAMQTLNCPTASLEQLKRTLTRAVRNVMERSQDTSDASLLIRVLISEESEATQEVGDEPNKSQVSGQTVQQMNRSLARGWGFFLIQKQADETPTLVGKSPHLIELFLYRERKPGRK